MKLFSFLLNLFLKVFDLIFMMTDSLAVLEETAILTTSKYEKETKNSWDTTLWRWFTKRYFLIVYCYSKGMISELEYLYIYDAYLHNWTYMQERCIAHEIHEICRIIIWSYMVCFSWCFYYLLRYAGSTGFLFCWSWKVRIFSTEVSWVNWWRNSNIIYWRILFTVLTNICLLKTCFRTMFTALTNIVYCLLFCFRTMFQNKILFTIWLFNF